MTGVQTCALPIYTIEYTLYIRVGCAIENLDAHVVVKNVKVAS